MNQDLLFSSTVFLLTFQKVKVLIFQELMAEVSFPSLNKKCRPISRILSSLIIYLDVILLLHSYRLPFYLKRAILKCRFTWRFTMQSLQDSTTALPVHTFCCTIPIHYRWRVLPATLLFGVRTFLWINSDKSACNTNIVFVDNFIKKNTSIENKFFSISIFVNNE